MDSSCQTLEKFSAAVLGAMDGGSGRREMVPLAAWVSGLALVAIIQMRGVRKARAARERMTNARVRWVVPSLFLPVGTSSSTESRSRWLVPRGPLARGHRAEARCYASL